MRTAFLYFSLLLTVKVRSERPPHIVFIVADDLGWNDVGWHNSDVKTPNLDRLARQGVILNQSYVQPYCSPSRSAFLTGLYPFHTGLQHVVITSTAPGGVPLNVTMLPQLLKKKGYATHMIGKWHLGYCKWEYTPRYRGFDTFMGFYGAEETYYERTVGPSDAFDFRHNETANRTYNGIYSTELFASEAQRIIGAHSADQPLFLYLAFQAVHAPLEVPSRYLSAYAHVKDERRRMLYGMVAALDEAVGNVTRALEASGLLSTTMVMFTSDNGAPVYFGGSNWPLRGAKGTLWEGGVRVPAFVYSPLLKHDGFTSNALFHATDWFTTILSLAGVRDHQMPIYALDGVDQSGVLHAQVQSNRSTMVYNINEFTGASAIRQGDYKLIVGYPGTWDAQYYEENNTRNHMSGFNVSIMNVVNFFENADVRSQVLNALDRKSQVRLFNLAEDPSESADLAEAMPEVVRRLVTLLRSYDATLMPIKFAPRAENADPKQWNNVITPGWCAATNATSEPTTASETRTSRSFYAPCSAVSCQSVSCLTAWLFMAIVPRLIIAMRCQFDIHY